MLSVRPEHCPMFTKRVVALCNSFPADVSCKIARLACDPSDFALHAACIQASFRAFKARAIFAVVKAANDDERWENLPCALLFEAKSVPHFRDLCVRLVMELNVWQWYPHNTLCIFTSPDVRRCSWSDVKASMGDPQHLAYISMFP